MRWPNRWSVSQSCSAAGAEALMHEENVLLGGSFFHIESPPFLPDGKVYAGQMENDKEMLRRDGARAPVQHEGSVLG